MIEIKQLQYLVVSADLQSFSRAADVLYTSQPNVSKVIRALEEELGFDIFVRQNRGIKLTRRGKHVYDYACKAIENVQQLTSYAKMDRGEELLISCNPSSWMAACFRAFYNENKESNVYYHVISAGSEDVIQRCASGMDELGFVYIPESQMLSFQYRLEKRHLEFEELKRTSARLYLGHQHPLYGKKTDKSISMEDIRLVQCYDDEFTLNRNCNLFGQREWTGPDPRVSVITNSDYVMCELLQNTDLANISSDYLSHEEDALEKSDLYLEGEKGQVIFGCIRRKEEPLGTWAARYLEHVKRRLSGQ